jgi:hypothetical protein
MNTNLDNMTARRLLDLTSVGLRDYSKLPESPRKTEILEKQAEFKKFTPEALEDLYNKLKYTILDFEFENSQSSMERLTSIEDGEFIVCLNNSIRWIGETFDDTVRGACIFINNFIISCEDSYGGEGQGDQYWRILKVVNTDTNETKYWQHDGYYASYDGGHYENIFEVKPVQETITVWKQTN